MSRNNFSKGEIANQARTNQVSAAAAASRPTKSDKPKEVLLSKEQQEDYANSAVKEGLFNNLPEGERLKAAKKWIGNKSIQRQIKLVEENWDQMKDNFGRVSDGFVETMDALLPTPKEILMVWGQAYGYEIFKQTVKFIAGLSSGQGIEGGASKAGSSIDVRNPYDLERASSRGTSNAGQFRGFSPLDQLTPEAIEKADKKLAEARKAKQKEVAAKVESNSVAKSASSRSLLAKNAKDQQEEQKVELRSVEVTLPFVADSLALVGDNIFVGGKNGDNVSLQSCIENGSITSNKVLSADSDKTLISYYINSNGGAILQRHLDVKGRYEEDNKYTYFLQPFSLNSDGSIGNLQPATHTYPKESDAMAANPEFNNAKSSAVLSDGAPVSISGNKLNIGDAPARSTTSLLVTETVATTTVHETASPTGPVRTEIVTTTEGTTLAQTTFPDGFTAATVLPVTTNSVTTVVTTEAGTTYTVTTPATATTPQTTTAVTIAQDQTGQYVATTVATTQRSDGTTIATTKPVTTPVTSSLATTVATTVGTKGPETTVQVINPTANLETSLTSLTSPGNITTVNATVSGITTEHNPLDFLADKKWQIVIGAVGGAIVLGAIAGCIYCCCKKRDKNKGEEPGVELSSESGSSAPEAPQPEQPKGPPGSLDVLRPLRAMAGIAEGGWKATLNGARRAARGMSGIWGGAQVVVPDQSQNLPPAKHPTSPAVSVHEGDDGQLYGSGVPRGQVEGHRLSAREQSLAAGSGGSSPDVSSPMERGFEGEGEERGGGGSGFGSSVIAAGVAAGAAVVNIIRDVVTPGGKTPGGGPRPNRSEFSLLPQVKENKKEPGSSAGITPSGDKVIKSGADMSLTSDNLRHRNPLSPTGAGVMSPGGEDSLELGPRSPAASYSGFVQARDWESDIGTSVSGDDKPLVKSVETGTSPMHHEDVAIQAGKPGTSVNPVGVELAGGGRGTVLNPQQLSSKPKSEQRWKEVHTGGRLPQQGVSHKITQGGGRGTPGGGIGK